jgi:hypothetical protein
MSNWKDMLRAHDPAAGATLPADDAAAMRRRVVGAVPAAKTSPAWWPQPLAFAAMVVLMIVAGVVAGRRLPVVEQRAEVEDVPRAIDAGERRQLQFATPGGTRIIWIFDPQFDTNETIP